MINFIQAQILQKDFWMNTNKFSIGKVLCQAKALFNKAIYHICEECKNHAGSD